MSSKVKNTDVWRSRNLHKESDLLVVEEPLQISLEFGPGDSRQQMDLAVTMRTPGHDFELALGFLYTEGIILEKNDILKIWSCEQVKPEEVGNVVRISLNPEVALNPDDFTRNFYVSSSCGVCGKQSIEQVKSKCRAEFTDQKFRLSHLLKAPETLRDKQDVYRFTGGLHASGLFSAEGELLLLREDIGRHNAVDKVIGAALQSDLMPLNNHFLVVSGRAGFELVQKALIAGIPVLVAVGAPSSLAVELAEQNQMTLIGFVRDGKFNVYCGKERLIV